MGLILAGVGIASALLVLGISGWWRYAFIAFTIPPRKMTVEELGLHVDGHNDVARVNHILESFLTGFNQMISRPRWTAWQKGANATPAMFRPFWHEGAAMGYTLRQLFRYDPAGFERDIVKPAPEFRYLYYVGLGFWSGMRNHEPQHVLKVVDGLDPLHRYLVFDGYGFKVGFFDAPKEVLAIRVLDEFPGYAQSAAYQGVGRSLYFRFMSRPQTMIQEMRKLGAHAIDAAAGVGLAVVFVNPDRLHVAQDLARRMPADWRPHFHLGMCFGLKARSINDVDEFERNVSKLPVEVRDAIGASIRECDRVELLVRSENREDGYEEWRRRVTQWMAGAIEYPLQRVITENKDAQFAAPAGAAALDMAGMEKGE